MRDLREPPPFSGQGDIHENRTYEGVGRVLSAWESLEFRLAQLYSTLISDQSKTGWEEYGQPRIFIDRLLNLRNAANNYFIRYCDQNLEGQLDKHLYEAERLSDRRNEIAHGIVYIISELSYFRDQMSNPSGFYEYGLIPPIYTLRKHAEGFPKYVYTHKTLREIEAEIYSLANAVHSYTGELISS